MDKHSASTIDFNKLMDALCSSILNDYKSGVIKLKTLIFFLVSLILGCSLHNVYERPSSLAPIVSQYTTQPKDKLFNAAAKTLIENGYRINYSDFNTGVISTAPHIMRVTSNQADCGKLGNTDYLMVDHDINSIVDIGIFVEHQNIEVNANFEVLYGEDEHRRANTLPCISKGILEKGLLHKILSQLH